jgi:hypothetical protein
MQDNPKQCDEGKAIRLNASLIAQIAYRVSIFRPLSILCFFSCGHTFLVLEGECVLMTKGKAE